MHTISVLSEVPFPEFTVNSMIGKRVLYIQAMHLFLFTLTVIQVTHAANEQLRWPSYFRRKTENNTELVKNWRVDDFLTGALTLSYSLL